MIDGRKCAEPGCGRIFRPKSARNKFCPAHRRSKPSRVGHNAKYGWSHRRLRAEVASRVRAGGATCVRCGQPILPGEEFDLGHVDGAGPHAYAGPEHTRCNRATASRNANGGQPGRWSRLEANVRHGIVRCGRCGWNIREGDAWQMGDAGPEHCACEREPCPPGPPYAARLRSLEL